MRCDKGRGCQRALLSQQTCQLNCCPPLVMLQQAGGMWACAHQCGVVGMHVRAAGAGWCGAAPDPLLHCNSHEPGAEVEGGKHEDGQHVDGALVGPGRPQDDEAREEEEDDGEKPCQQRGEHPREHLRSSRGQGG